MNGLAMTNERGTREHVLFQRRVDLVEVDIGDKAIDRRVDGGGLWSKNKSVVAEQIRHDTQIVDTSRIDLLRLIAANALIVIPQPVVFARGFEIARAHICVRCENGVAERRPEAVVAPA